MKDFRLFELLFGLVIVHIVIFWVVTSCSLVGRWHSFGGTRCFYRQVWSYSSEWSQGCMKSQAQKNKICCWHYQLANLYVTKVELSCEFLSTVWSCSVRCPTWGYWPVEVMAQLGGCCQFWIRLASHLHLQLECFLWEQGMTWQDH
jgi:hypothetical protein